MKRRHFLMGLAAAARAPVKITSISMAQVQGRFHKFVAMNSYDRAPKGHTYENTLVRIATNQGVEGVGIGSRRARPDDLRGLIGANPLELYEMAGGRITGRAPAWAPLLERERWLDGPLFDLIGKLLGKPCWALMGDAGRDEVEVYDGTLYFSDVWFRDRGVRAVMEEAEEALKKGYVGLKLKAGRGDKWMERDAGLQRDIEVLHAARKLAGPEVKIMADPNNGYRNDFERAWALVRDTGAAKLYWMEEIFPENVDDYTRLRERMEGAAIDTLIAEGESVTDPERLAPYLKPPRTVDVLQMDIHAAGFLNNLKMARMGAEAGALTVPHNWASHLGMLMGLHMAKASPAVPAAEDDRSSYDVIDSSAYTFRKGYYRVPDLPGMGIQVNEKVYSEKYRAGEVRIA
ncbi:MAG: enolase C-terminal domain-like protein [Bryobacteraceae bacterium]